MSELNKTEKVVTTVVGIALFVVLFGAIAYVCGLTLRWIVGNFWEPANQQSVWLYWAIWFVLGCIFKGVSSANKESK